MTRYRVIKFLTHPVTVALFLGTIIWILIPVNMDPFRFEIAREEYKGNPDIRYSFFDLNSDGKINKLEYYYLKGQVALVLVFKNEDVVYDEWNFLGQFHYEAVGDFISDYDKDGFKEVSFFTIRNDSILLNIIEPFDNKKHLIRDFFVDTIGVSNFSPVLNVVDFKPFDLDKDEKDELVFVLALGFVKQPRSMYVFDPDHSTIHRTPYSGISFETINFYDLDFDGFPEIIPGTNAPNNYELGNIHYPDTVTYCMVLDSNLAYKSGPFRAGSIFSYSKPIAVSNGSSKGLWILAAQQTENGIIGKYYKFNPDYSLEPKDDFPLSSGLVVGQVLDLPTAALTVIGDHTFTKVLGISEGKRSFEQVINHNISLCDIKNVSHGRKDVVFAQFSHAEQDQLGFYNQNGKLMGRLSIRPTTHVPYLYWLDPDGNEERMFVGTDKYNYYVSISRSGYWYHRYGLLIFLVLSVFGFVWIIRAIQIYQIRNKEGMKREILELQLKSVRNQLDPHFTFNALNTLSALSLAGDQKGVDHFVTHFSRLLRTHLQTADKILIPLKEEIEFVINYVELQRIRFENSMELQLDIPGSVDLSRKIPRMLLQTHVENAIKHGIHGAGIIWIRAREENERLILEVEDNGSGRGNSKATPIESTGTGLIAQERILKSVRELYHLKIKSETIDLTDSEGNPRGTVIHIIVG